MTLASISATSILWLSLWTVNRKAFSYFMAFGLRNRAGAYWILIAVFSDTLPNTVRVVKSRRMRWTGHVARKGQGRGVYRVLVGKPEGKRPLGRPRRRWEDNIKMDLQGVGGSCGDWMELAQDRDRWRVLVSTVMNPRVPKIRGISWLAAEPVSFSRMALLHGVSK